MEIEITHYKAASFLSKSVRYLKGKICLDESDKGLDSVKQAAEPEQAYLYYDPCVFISQMLINHPDIEPKDILAKVLEAVEWIRKKTSFLDRINLFTECFEPKSLRDCFEKTIDESILKSINEINEKYKNSSKGYEENYDYCKSIVFLQMRHFGYAGKINTLLDYSDIRKLDTFIICLLAEIEHKTINPRDRKDLFKTSSTKDYPVVNYLNSYKLYDKKGKLIKSRYSENVNDIPTIGAVASLRHKKIQLEEKVKSDTEFRGYLEKALSHIKLNKWSGYAYESIREASLSLATESFFLWLFFNKIKVREHRHLLYPHIPTLNAFSKSYFESSDEVENSKSVVLTSSSESLLSYPYSYRKDNGNSSPELLEGSRESTAGCFPLRCSIS